MIRSTALFALAVLPWSAAVAAVNQDALNQRVAEVVMGVTMGVLLHELGHAMIGELELPATGPEEDTVDEFSAVAMSQLVTDRTDRLAVNAATYSSLLWWRWAQVKEREGQFAPWHGEHAPDLRRFRHTFCVLFGADPVEYSGLADRFEVDQRFKDRCVRDYRKKVDAWEEILALRGRHLGPDEPGVHPATTPGGRLRIVFHDSSNEYAPFAKLLFDVGLAELTDYLSEYLVWPRDLLVEFKDCGYANASYSPDAGAVTMCYDLIQYASQIVLQAEGIAAVPSQRGSIMSFVQGTWSARVVAASHPLDVTITYYPDQTYLIEEVWVPAGLQAGGLAARIEGTWAAVEGGAANQMFIHRQPEQWLPQESCYYTMAACGSETQAYPAQIIDQNAIYVDGIVWSRTR